MESMLEVKLVVSRGVQRHLVFVCCLVGLFVLPLFAQAQELSLSGRSSLELEFGLWGGIGTSSTVGLSGTQSEVKGTGYLGGLTYAYGLEENLAVTVSAGVLAVQATSTVGLTSTSQHVSSVVPVLIGVRYYVPYPKPDGKVRPFLAAGIGSYIGTETKNEILVQESRTETAFGGRLGVGVDFHLGSHFKLAALVGHHLMTDFATPISGRRNYNGTGFGMEVGYIF